MARDFYPLFMTILFPPEDMGSGGLGAVSVAVSAEVGQISIAFLGLIPALAVNRWLAKRARAEQGRLRFLYCFHSELLLAIGFGNVLLVLAIPFGDYLTFPGMFAVGGLTLAATGVQFLVLAGMLLVIS